MTLGKIRRAKERQNVLKHKKKLEARREKRKKEVELIKAEMLENFDDLNRKDRAYALKPAETYKKTFSDPGIHFLSSLSTMLNEEQQDYVYRYLLGLINSNQYLVTQHRNGLYSKSNTYDQRREFLHDFLTGERSPSYLGTAISTAKMVATIIRDIKGIDRADIIEIMPNDTCEIKYFQKWKKDIWSFNDFFVTEHDIPWLVARILYFKYTEFAYNAFKNQLNRLKKEAKCAYSHYHEMPIVKRRNRRKWSMVQVLLKPKKIQARIKTYLRRTDKLHKVIGMCAQRLGCPIRTLEIFSPRPSFPVRTPEVFSPT